MKRCGRRVVGRRKEGRDVSPHLGPASRALTHSAGHEVDPGRLHLDVEPVAVRHEQPCRRKAVGRMPGPSRDTTGNSGCSFRRAPRRRLRARRRGPPQVQPQQHGSPRGCPAPLLPRTPPTPGWPPPVPGTRMSPKPSREKGRSHRASGEALSLGTFRTMGSWGGREAAVSGTRPSPPLTSGQRLGHGPTPYLLMGG